MRAMARLLPLSLMLLPPIVAALVISVVRKKENKNTQRNRSDLPYPYPMLVLFAQSGYPYTLFNINDKSHYKFKYSSWFVQQTSKLSKILGLHRNGWVIVMDKGIYIFHLFLRSRQIKLPTKIADGTSLRIVTRNDIRKAILFADDPDRPHDFVVVISFHGLSQQLAFWRYGYRNWTTFGDESESCAYDIAFCNNTMYAIREGYLESWEFNNNLSLPEKKLHIPLKDSMSEHRLVVSYEDAIFIVNFSYWSKLVCKEDSGNYWSKLIYKLDFSENKCISLRSLNGRSLFWGSGDSVILSAVDVLRLGLKPNSIYLVEKSRDGIKLSNYSFDYCKSGGIWKLNEWSEHHQLLHPNFDDSKNEKIWKSMELGEYDQPHPFGLFL